MVTDYFFASNTFHKTSLIFHPSFFLFLRDHRVTPWIGPKLRRMVRPRLLLGMFQCPLPFLKLNYSNFIFEHLIFGQKWCFIRINPHFPRHIRTYTGCKPIKKHLSAMRDKQTVVKLMNLIYLLLIPGYNKLPLQLPKEQNV